MTCHSGRNAGDLRGTAPAGAGPLGRRHDARSRAPWSSSGSAIGFGVTRVRPDRRARPRSRTRERVSPVTSFAAARPGRRARTSSSRPGHLGRGGARCSRSRRDAGLRRPGRLADAGRRRPRLAARRGADRPRTGGRAARPGGPRPRAPRRPRRSRSRSWPSWSRSGAAGRAFVASPGPATLAGERRVAPPSIEPVVDDIVLLDPVCGMTVERADARHLAEHDGRRLRLLLDRLPDQLHPRARPPIVASVGIDPQTGPDCSSPRPEDPHALRRLRARSPRPRDRVWAFVIDPNQVGTCGPGVESIEAVDDDPLQGDGQGRDRLHQRPLRGRTWSSPRPSRRDAPGQGPRSGTRQRRRRHGADAPVGRGGRRHDRWTGAADVNIAARSPASARG